MIKSHTLMRLEDVGFLRQNGQTGEWNIVSSLEDCDITPLLLAAGMFEH